MHAVYVHSRVVRHLNAKVTASHLIIEFLHTRCTNVQVTENTEFLSQLTSIGWSTEIFCFSVGCEVTNHWHAGCRYEIDFACVLIDVVQWEV